MPDYSLNPMAMDTSVNINERNALGEERDRARAECIELRAEIKRLRAALEEIASDPTGVSAVQAEIAREALEERG